MGISAAYESDEIADMTGETLRPGGFDLTDISVRFCHLSPGDSVLDLGCGRGATVNYLHTKYRIAAVGLDPSEKMIEAAKGCYGYTNFVIGEGAGLPFASNSFEGVFAECTLSLMDNPDRVFEQANRVLKAGGWFVITDVYARNQHALTELGQYPAGGCLRGMHNLGEFGKRLQKAGFTVEHTQDYTRYLTELYAKIIFTYGSLSDFWQTVAGGYAVGDGYYQTIKQCKPGYFLMIARKRGNKDD